MRDGQTDGRTDIWLMAIPRLLPAYQPCFNLTRVPPPEGWGPPEQEPHAYRLTLAVYLSIWVSQVLSGGWRNLHCGASNVDSSWWNLDDDYRMSYSPNMPAHKISSRSLCAMRCFFLSRIRLYFTQRDEMQWKVIYRGLQKQWRGEGRQLGSRWPRAPDIGGGAPDDRGENFWQGSIRAQNSKSDRSPRKVIHSTKHFKTRNRPMPS